MSSPPAKKKPKKKPALTNATHCLVAKLHFILYLCGYFSKLFASAKIEGFMADPGAFCLKKTESECNYVQWAPCTEQKGKQKKIFFFVLSVIFKHNQKYQIFFCIHLFLWFNFRNLSRGRSGALLSIGQLLLFSLEIIHMLESGFRIIFGITRLVFLAVCHEFFFFYTEMFWRFRWSASRKNI